MRLSTGQIEGKSEEERRRYEGLWVRRKKDLEKLKNAKIKNKNGGKENRGRALFYFHFATFNILIFGN